jgi:dGTPase
MKKEIKKNMLFREHSLSNLASKNQDAIRFHIQKKDFRTEYFRDIDKILYSLSYFRYADKTQVFTNVDNDMISKRISHVQMVSKIARTIGRALRLNEDLIEAASLGHDLGHVPFGHEGERILNEISLKHGQGYFAHNVQSVRTLIEIENKGLGNNITLQVLDAILCHNGEMIQNIYYPQMKTKEMFLNEYYESYKNKDILKKIKPMTLEGCVVRISDVVAYIGKDIEDAIRLNIIKKETVPQNIISTLGETNSEIVNTIINDIIENSLNKNYIKLSKKVFKTLQELIEFNYKNIYKKANTAEQLEDYKVKFNKLFDLYLEHITQNKTNEDIYTLYLNDMDSSYTINNSPQRIVIDFLAGMTDNFFNYQYQKYFNKQKV